MIEINFVPEEMRYAVHFYSSQFYEIVALLKLLRGTYEPDEKLWYLAPAKVNELISRAATIGEQVQESVASKKALEDFYNSLNELVYSEGRNTVNYDMMAFPPLVGKHPNEDYQRNDIYEALGQNRYIFNWEMGLGKSYAIATIINNLRQRGEVDRVLGFTTGTGSYNLKKELCKLGNFSEDEVLVIANTKYFKTKKENRELFNKEKYPQKIIILVYDVLKAVEGYYGLKYATSKTPRKKVLPLKEWFGDYKPIIILDEMHSLANPKSGRGKLFLKYMDEFFYRYGFTGTFADKYEKLYMPARIMSKKLIMGYSYNDWLHRYNSMTTTFKDNIINPDEWDLAGIGRLSNDLISTYGTKRLIDDCIELPEQVYVKPIYIEMDPLQRSIYEDFIKESVKAKREQKEGFTQSGKNLFSFFQLAVDNPSTIANSKNFETFSPELQKKVLSYDYNKMYNKLEVIDTILSEEEEKGIIWYYHPLTKDALKEKYKDYGITVIEQGDNYEEIFAKAEAFLKDPKQKILIASIIMANTSLTLLECKWSVYLEKTYNYTHYKQSLGRMHRPGQTSKTKVYSVLYDRSLDTLQYENLQSKGTLMDSIMNKSVIKMDDWKKIFNGDIKALF